MTERILFLTGHLARPRLERVLAEIQRPDFEWAIVDIGVKVAALMTQAIIARRLPRPVEASRVVVPGRCRADLTELSSEFGVRFERGPDELKDLPVFSADAHVQPISRGMTCASSPKSSTLRSCRSVRSLRARSEWPLPAPTSSISAVCRTSGFRISKTASAPSRASVCGSASTPPKWTNSGAARGPAPISC